MLQNNLTHLYSRFKRLLSLSGVSRLLSITPYSENPIQDKIRTIFRIIKVQKAC